MAKVFLQIASGAFSLECALKNTTFGEAMDERQDQTPIDKVTNSDCNATLMSTEKKPSTSTSSSDSSSSNASSDASKSSTSSTSTTNVAKANSNGSDRGSDDSISPSTSSLSSESPAPKSDETASPKNIGKNFLDEESKFQKPILNRSDKIMLAYATGFGAGYSPKAPGTMGTLVGLLIQLAICHLSPSLQILTVTVFVLLAIHAAKVAGRYFGNSDDRHIVSDEIAGYLVTMLFVPTTPLNLLAGFVLFRTFDILKPWPCSYFDKRRKDALGNVMDDVCAGIYSRCLIAIWMLIW